MSDDGFINWFESSNAQELAERFIEKKGLSDEFQAWAYTLFQSEQADYGDYLYEMERDRRLGI